MSDGRLIASWRRGVVALAGLCLLPSAPAIAQEAAAPAAPTQAAPERFMIAAFDVEGVRSLSAGVIENAVYPHSGPDRGSNDLEAARKAIQDIYAARGMESVQVEIPPQPSELFAQGVIQLRVTEAPVGQVRVTGARHHSPQLVRDQLPSVAEGRPLDLKALETELAAANRFPDRAVSPAFSSGKVPGTIDVELKVDDELPLHGSLELNNDHSPSTTSLRAVASLRYTNVWQLGHSLSATYIVAPEDMSETSVVSASYSAPLIGTPWTLVFYGYTSNSNIATLGGVNVLGDGYQVGVRGVYRLPGDKLFQSVSFGFDYKNFSQDIFVGDEVAGQAPIEYLPLFGSYTLSSASEKANLDVTASVTAGLRAFKKIRCFEATADDDCVPTDQFKNKDFDSNENFLRANLEIGYSQVLPLDFVAAVRLTGQVADSHLVTNEQYAVGGLSNVRGYFQAEGVGDDGVSTSIELRSPSLAAYIAPFVDELRLFAFFDSGKTWVQKVSADQDSQFSLASSGGGIRFKLFNHFNGEVVVGVPLIDGPSSRAGEPRATFTARGEF